MLKILKVEKDSYITNRVIKNKKVTSSNVGSAGSLDLFKLYAFSYSGSVPNVELSRLLLKYDLSSLIEDFQNGRLDINSTSFNCTIKLFDVYGGQPTPSNFNICAFPLSRSFDEGLGKDVVYYSDYDVCNYISASRASGEWYVSGCGLGDVSTQPCDYISQLPDGTSLQSKQFFNSGIEDLELDVTTTVSATLAGIIPNEGFRISYDSIHESDKYSYFVKRFASRTAYDHSKRPQLIVKYDDSIQDDSNALLFNSTNTVFLYSNDRDKMVNLVSGTTEILGENCLKLKLSTEISGGWYSYTFAASQHKIGTNFVAGVYSSSFTLSKNEIIQNKLDKSGSVNFTPIWCSNDETVGFYTGSVMVAHDAKRSGLGLDDSKFTVSVHNLQDSYYNNEKVLVRVNLFDQNTPILKLVKLPVELPGVIMRNVHYQIRDNDADKIVIPFDNIYNSTKLSNDSEGMYFNLDVSNLSHGRNYVVDIMIISGATKKIYKSASPIFYVLG